MNLLPFLAETDLAAAPDRVRFTPTHLDIDDLYKLWSMMSGTPFALSLCYLASVVAIDGRSVPVPGRRVETRVVRVDPIEADPIEADQLEAIAIWLRNAAPLEGVVAETADKLDA